MKKLLIGLIVVLISCSEKNDQSLKEPKVFLVVLGIAQDAGYPQVNCTKACCAKVWNGEVSREKVVSLGLVDRLNNKVYMFEATPDFKDQLHHLLEYLPEPDINSVGGIFLTHAHMGHYTGLMELGHEALGASNVPVYAMPKMSSYLSQNGPWSQLVSFNNIAINEMQADSAISLPGSISITPFLVPHRDEYSETVGYKITADNKNALFIPDIDKWFKWDRSIRNEIQQVDYAFLDATFYSENELPNRNMSEIGHPYVSETMELFDSSPDSIKRKIVFIHFNHTNALIKNGEDYKLVINQHYSIAREGEIYSLEQ